MAQKKPIKRGTKQASKAAGPARKKAGGRQRARYESPKKLQRQRRKQPDPNPAKARGFTVVGLGASAGGLDAFKQFFKVMPADTGMAFVLIQHLDPDHESLTGELLARVTEMKVAQAEDGMSVEPNRVYVIPPNKYLSVSGERLRLSELEHRRGLRMPIDFFLRSLATEQEERAIGVILSGTGTDGTLGLREIKAGCGLVMVQTPETCQFDGMVTSAIATGLVDYVLPIDKMPDALVRYTKHQLVNGDALSTDAAEKAPDDLHGILGLLRARIKYDFSCYKKGTLTRRIQRRMGLLHIVDVRQYTELLRQEPDEVNALYKDLLIGVTNFFREPESWLVLEREVIRNLVREHSDDQPIRVWSPGCATGEEPYSIAMLLAEQIEKAEKACDLQIFASDIDSAALASARGGVYPENIAADVSPERLRRFFVKREHTYRINKQIRETVTFAEQNLISNAPFSKLSLVSCRNLLIYLEPQMQAKILALFHFALREGGYLFLGSSESIGGMDDLFHTVSRKHRIYRRVGPVRYDKLEFPSAKSDIPREIPGILPESVEPRGRRLTALAQELVLSRFAPACVLVNRKAEVLYLQGPVDEYLQLPSGELAADLLALAREGLRSKLRVAMQSAIVGGRPVRVSGARVNRGGKYRFVNVSIEPLKQPSDVEGLLLVSFEDTTSAGQAKPGATTDLEANPAYAILPAELDSESAASYEAVVHQLEDELRRTSETLQSTIEELQTSNEEFRASHEEATSINEELQSTNEELETSKEELQSLSEELLTVNTQLEQKVLELEGSNNDLNNLLASTEIATIFLDHQLRLKRFTPVTTRLVRVRDSDLGRPITDFALNFTDDALLTDAAIVLERPAPIDAEIQDSEGRWYLRRVVPYRDEEHRIDGVVLTFVDITHRKEQEQQSLDDKLERHMAELADMERQRLGRDLHDSLGQQMSGLGMLVATLRQQLGDKTAWTDDVARLEASVDAAKIQLRSLAKGLSPVDVDADGLRVALSELAEQTTQAHHVDCRFECPEAIPINDNFTATQLYLIASEAVHNAVKHAAAKSIVIRLQGLSAPRLSIVDDGSGVQVDIGRSTGMGIQIMRHRCDLIGGAFTFQSQPEGDTDVTCALPADPPKKEESPGWKWSRKPTLDANDGQT